MDEQDIMENVIPLTEGDIAKILEAWKADIDSTTQG